ncbi:uncharacterized protein [Blastocystis hominis]|uniref:NADH dehydrogenase [ubiquinone] 1 beta subcomplex subunit 7 n=1 Tax=Blastocystis hominis TaxID=12968 RepID=D8LXY6_BLAHO|nr:uncharacterized protein [Blastocystis hominis]CBK20441.2 unnamed protein product [Blastocystis hominis]|eukprot:XP_012894489.1 uncharacterized protein [Blastocystis hominis]
MEQPTNLPTEQELKDARIPPTWRDNCSHILIPLNKCRREHNFMMNKCVELKHAYEKCQHDEWEL